MSSPSKVQHAVEEARKSTYRKRLGAVVFSKNKVVGRGHNKLKTHPKLSKMGYYTIHAECDALMRASGGDTLVVHIFKNGNLACSKPCERCMVMAKSYNIKRVIYVDWNGSVQEMRI